VRLIDDLVGAALAQRLLDAQSQQQRDVAISAATAATLSTELVDPVVEEAFGDLLQENRSVGMRSAIEAIEEDLDDRAWRLQTAVEAGQAADEDYHTAFRRARAAGSVKTFFDDDSRAALNETVYEAVHAVDRDERLLQLLGAVVDLVAPGNHWAGREFANLFWPRFIQVDGCVLLAGHYTPDNLAAWRERRPDNRAAIEDVINHVHLEDLAIDRVGAAKQNAVAQQLATAWRSTLHAEFSGQQMRVEIDGSILTAFSSV
jgi:hypothetical protein